MTRRKTTQMTDAELGWFHPTDTEEQRRRRDEWLKQQAENRRETDEARRALFNAFNIWTICPHKICRRNKGCSGDTTECVMQRWRRVVPDEVRIYIAKVAAFVTNQGMTVKQACAATEADLKERAEIAARHEARAAARSSEHRPDER